MIGRFSPRPGSSSAAQYAIASIGIKIDDYSGRGFGVKGRPYLPPVNSFYGVANPALGYALGAANSLIKSLANISSPSPSSNPQEDTYAANDSGANLASSESDEETLTDLERLVKEQDKYKKAADAKKKELEAKKKDLPQEDDPAASIEIENINEQIEKIEEEQKAYNKKVNETLEKATESINANKKDCIGISLISQIKAKILSGDTEDIKARVNGLAPESKAELNKMIQSILKKDQQEKDLNQSNAVQRSLAMTAPPPNIDQNSLDFNTMFS